MYVPQFNVMGDDEVRRFLDVHPSAHLVTVGPDGRPDATLLHEGIDQHTEQLDYEQYGGGVARNSSRNSPGGHDSHCHTSLRRPEFASLIMRAPYPSTWPCS